MPNETTAATLEEVLAAVSVEHQRIPMFDGGLGQRCVGCDSLRGESDGPNSPRHAEHVAVEQAAAVRAWLADRLADEGLREAVARALAQMEPGEDWPTNEALGGGPTGTRDDEYRWAMNEEATAALAAVTAALTTPPPNPTTTEEPR